jgi:hypothetical protein
LITAPDLELEAVLEQRAHALAGQAAGAPIPWGPALTGSGDHRGTLATDAGDRGVLRITLATLDHLVVPDHLPDDFDVSFGDRDDETATAGDPIEAEPSRDDADPAGADLPAEADRPGTEDAAIDDPELARATRELLVKMYDPRANAAVLVDATTPKAEPRTPRAEPKAEQAARRPRSRRTRVVVVLALVASVFTWRAASEAWRDSADPLADSSAPVTRLPWQEVSFGDIVAQFPGTSAPSTFGDDATGVYTHQRFDLPDVTITVISTAPEGVAGNDIALRGVADRLLQSVGGRVDSGGVVDTGWGTAFSGRGATLDGEAYVYVVLTRGSLVEVLAETPGPAGERAQQIVDRITRSFQPS